mgnify:CR=1 FL=1
MNEATAKIKYLKIAPRKARLVANAIKGMTVNEAEAQLMMRDQRSAPVLLKLLRSAVANAKQKKLEVNKLLVKSIMVDQGPMLKRFLPRAMGRATPIHKKTSHITIVLTEAAKEFPNRFTILPKEKKVKKTSKSKSRKTEPKAEARIQPKVEEKPGFFRRIFRRKSI